MASNSFRIDRIIFRMSARESNEDLLTYIVPLYGTSLKFHMLEHHTTLTLGPPAIVWPMMRAEG